MLDIQQAAFKDKLHFVYSPKGERSENNLWNFMKSDI